MRRTFGALMVIGLLVLQAGVTSAASGSPGSVDSPAALPPLDPYGGDAGTALAATGFFRTEQVGGRWWLVTPDGHPFFSAGVNHVDSVGTVDKNGHAAYAETVAAKYGSDAAWATAQAPRLKSWGFNTLGGWSDSGLFAGKDMPHTEILNFAGQSFVTGNMADFWSPAWVSNVQTTSASAAAAHKDDPWLVGYFLDNELHWVKDWRFLDQLDLYLQRGAATPGKQHLVAWLQQHYGGDFAAFAVDFPSTATDWASLATTTEVTGAGPGSEATRAAWAGELAERYFSVTADALKAADPNHLNLGPRFITQLTTPEVAAAAGRHVDVVSVNWYDVKPEFITTISQLGPAYVPTANTLEAWSTLTGKPLLISEFGFRAMDSGLPNTWPPFQVVLQTQQERAAAYVNYVDCAINTGYVVGTHWFELVDEPAIGRSDGENDNWGLLTEGDDEYPEVTAASATLLDHAYRPLTEPNAVPLPCTPIGPQPPPPSSTTTTVTALPSTSTSAGSASAGPVGGQRNAGAAASPVVAVPRFTA